MPKTLEEFIWILFVAITVGMFWLIRYCYKRHDCRITDLEKKNVLTDDECQNCITKAFTKAIKEEFDNFVRGIKDETKGIKNKQEELREVLPERYVKKEDLKEATNDLKERFKTVEEGLQFLIEEGFRDGQKKKANR